MKMAILDPCLPSLRAHIPTNLSSGFSATRSNCPRAGSMAPTAEPAHWSCHRVEQRAHGCIAPHIGGPRPLYARIQTDLPQLHLPADAEDRRQLAQNMHPNLLLLLSAAEEAETKLKE